MNPNRLRAALSAGLGQTLTPERAAAIERAACAPPAALPSRFHVGDGVDLEQRLEHFRRVNAALATFHDSTTAIVIANARAVALYSDFTAHGCTYTLVSDGSGHWLTRAFIQASVRYPFVQLGLKRLTASVAEDNTPSLHITRRMGFVEEGRLRLDRGDKDSVIFGMTRESCRWLQGGKQ